MRQFDSEVNDFMDSLIEESASLEPAPLPAVFSPPLSDKERNKLRFCPSTCLDYQSNTRCVGCQHSWTKSPHYTLGHTHTFSPKKINLLAVVVTLFPVGISGLLMARASTLSVAGPSLSKLTRWSWWNVYIYTWRLKCFVAFVYCSPYRWDFLLLGGCLQLYRA